MHPLKVERELRGWSQAKVAEVIGTSIRTVMRWELGQALPQPYYREQLCALFGKNARELGLLTDADPQEIVAPLAVLEKSASYLTDHTIPVSLGNSSSLFGRGALLEQLKQRLERGSGQVALQGLPGAGKTTLAVALTQDLDIQEYFKDGILWAGLGSNPDVLGQLARWAKLLDIKPQEVENAASISAWRQALRAAIGKRRMLLVVDDVWRVEDALAMQVGGPNCVHIITTRLPQVGYAFAAEGMVNVAELEETEGIALLARFVPQLVQQDIEGARALVQAVGALPLAITLMGKYLAAQSFAGQPRRLQNAIKLLQDRRQSLQLAVPVTPEELSPGLPEHTPLSLQASIAISEQRLSAEEREALSALAVFPAKPNCFSEEAALAVSGAPEAVLDTLWDAGLLETSGPGRYTLHQTVASYAGQHTGQEARRRMARYMVEYTREHAEDFDSLEQEMVNILAALDCAGELEMEQELFQGVDSLLLFMRVRGLYVKAGHYLKMVLKLAEKTGDTARRINALCYLGSFAELRAEYHLADSYSREGLALARQSGQTYHMSKLLTTLGLVAANRKESSQAQSFFEEGLKMARLTGDKKQLCYLSSYLGRIFRIEGNYLKAYRLYQEGLDLAYQIEHHEGTSCLLSNLAYVTAIFGNFKQAEEYNQEGLQVAERIGHRELLTLHHNIAGILALYQKKYQEARSHFEIALELARYIANQHMICNQLSNLGLSNLNLGNYAQAEAYLMEGINLARTINYPRAHIDMLMCLGGIAEQQENQTRARQLRQEGLGLMNSLDANGMVRYTTREWGELRPNYQQLERETNEFYEILTVNTKIRTDDVNSIEINQVENPVLNWPLHLDLEDQLEGRLLQDSIAI